MNTEIVAKVLCTSGFIMFCILLYDLKPPRRILLGTSFLLFILGVLVKL